ncbi:MAG: DUF488 domain-containing protein [Chloroflexi bacterium]|nr:DUF488 domain-containing protein [Chloroflexota bacterium]
MAISDQRSDADPNFVVTARQSQLLGLLDAVGGRARRIDFQKLLFLYCQEVARQPPYDFVPYRLGAFSFTSYHDRRKLVDAGLLLDGDDWQLTELGQRIALDFREGSFEIFAKQYAHLSGDDLVADTYRRYPYYATRSEIVENVLSDDKMSRLAVKHASPEFSGPSLLTIGYEGRSIEGYLNVLLEAGVTLLCDVRYNAVSRKYGFSRRTLENACRHVGITYEHLPSLGIPSEERRNANSPKARRALLQKYRQKTLPTLRDEIETLLGWLSDGYRMALMCYERHPGDCHRGHLAAAVDAYLGANKPTHQRGDL